ncbi:Phosphopantetheine attachment site [Pseudomonas sp. LAMO17WK12:I10]|uniref:beta-ketoacyl synthase N-terminal-like domain-containing protein n=1 Tax=unclassified Pseudomonas TaxID=196821 RepID=UPI000BD1B62C|nr:MULTISPECIES: beta-ketoacyl synthase N-terminal-like domain-containing protein [unclassified Pseudomonas]PXX69496.1 polyketide synthase PksJ/polyketide synthase PksN [Pseudomonas sp. LAMO17WK12:I9]SNY32819.1 Phosphopantetheine attachment site [Pseudomonas sp. LAMO17WK12:I10]
MNKYFDLTLGAEHPLVAHHRVQGQSVLPGLAYIDLLLRVARDGLGLDCLHTQVRDLVIYQPLIVQAGSALRLTLALQPQDDAWGVDVDGVVLQGEAVVGAKVQYCTARLHPTLEGAGARPDLDLAALRAEADSQVPLQQLYAQARQRQLVHDGLLLAEGCIHRFPWGCLIELGVAPQWRQLMPDALFHPTLVDGAAVASAVLEDCLPAGDDGLYLPLHYGSFQARALLQEACVARVELARISTANDIRKLDIDFYDLAGRWVASLGELTGKRVRATLGASAVQAPQAPQRAQAAKAAGPELASAILAVFARHLQTRVDQVDPQRGFFDMGLSSAQMLTILKDIEQLLSRRLNPTLLFEHNTVEELLGHLRQLAPTPQSTAPVSDGQLMASAAYRFAADEAYLLDHRVDGQPALMGITYPSLVLHTALASVAGLPLSLQDIRFHGGPLKLQPGQVAEVEVNLAADGGTGFRVHQRLAGEGASLCCEGRLQPAERTEPAALDLKALIGAARPCSQEQIDSWYRAVPAFALGPMLKTLVAAYEGADGSLICEVELGATERSFVNGLALDPLLLNSCYLFPVSGQSPQGAAATFVPLLIERLTLWRRAGRKAFVVTGPKRVKDGFIAFDSLIVDAEGRALASLVNASLRRLEPSVAPRPAAAATRAQVQAQGGHRVAVIGMAGRFPQAYDLDGFWQNLQAGKDCISEIPASRWDWRDYYSDNGEPGTISSKWGGFIDDAATFDPLFFQISPREAEVMDPLERLFLQHAWMAMEDAGYTREALQRGSAGDGAANVGIYAGVMGQEYPLFAAQSTTPMGLGGGTSSVATRMAYVGNFNGPAMAIDTMCSSSLVALDMACQALRSGAVDTAFAGGVNLSLHPSKYLMLSQGQFISSKGHCESFGEGGDGYIPGEGVGVLLLKRLEDAERDGDFIYGVIRGTAVNHGGRASGYTVPNPSAQTQVIRQALQRAAVTPDQISYIEAHGTGTKLGDPIEISGLTRAFEHDPGQPRETPCLIGSVKSNIGHCEGAAGVAGLIKVLLQMQHQVIVPSLHSQTLNPNIDFSLTPFQVNQQLVPWPVKEGQGRRIAGISSFGAGGVNAHAIVEDYPPAPVQARSAAVWLILLSARDTSRLPLMAGNLLAAIERLHLCDDALPSLAYTLQVGREAMEHRVATVVASLDELKERLHSLAASAVDPQWQRGSASQGKDTQDLYRDEDARQLLHTWLDKANLPALARVWVLGVAVPWAQLYGPRQGFERLPRRLPLPAYPFKNERYWLAAFAPAIEHPAAPEKALSTAQNALFEQQWSLRPAMAGTPAHSREAGFMLIICTAATQALAERLAAGLDAARIVPISELALRAEPLCKVNGHELYGVLDITGCDPAFVERCTHDLEGWFEGLQRLVEQTRMRDIRLLYVSRYLEAFQRPASLAPAAQAAVPACLYRCLGAEYQRLRSGHMDTDLAADDPLLVAQIIEQMYRAPHERHVCHRAGQVYLPALRAMAERAARPAFSLPGEQALWITGGTRGLGLLCAQHFVTRYGVRKLVLSGREALPPPAQWPALLAGPASPLQEKLIALSALQQQGVELLTLAVDMNDAGAMQQAVARIGRELGPVGGVIHCAGLGDYNNPALIRKPLADVQKVLAPKTRGLDNLYRALQGSPLSLCVLYSSVSAQLPELAAGQIDYAMANAYLDAFAAQHQADKVLSLQWPSWTDTGMGAMDSALYRGTGLLGLSDQDGLALLDRALASGRSGVLLPACFNSDLWLQAPIPQAPVAAQASAAPAGAAVAGDALEAQVQQWLSGLFTGELRIAAADFDPRLDFANYGLDSILMAQILRTINRRLKVDLAPSLILEHPNLRDLSQWLLAHQGSALEQAFAVDAAAPAPKLPQPASVLPGPMPGPSAPVPKMTSGGREAEDNEIVVVGMSARFPGAASLDDYWRLLKEGRSALAPVSSRRWPDGAHYLAGTLENPDCFDRETFHIPPEDFHAMDPQALMVLEECLKLWAHAGYRVEETRGSATGVYLGGRARSSLDPEALRQARNPIVVAGQNYLAANLSHFFDFSGPSLLIDTACSSALVGMGMAVQALRSGEIDAAVVGGVSLLDGERTHALFQQRGLLSVGTGFHLFDERADGIVLGEGVGLVLLKTAARARLDGDTVYARLSALASNNDGRTAGPATPNVQRQKAVMGKALGQSGLTPGQIDYIEVNGSGSQVTDLLELKAIDAVYGQGQGVGRSAGNPCGLGSIKPNIGHPLCAEGIASFIKAVLMIQHHSLVPFLSGQLPLRHFDLERSAFYFPRNAVALPEGRPVRIALNCFADGGNNVHAILQSPAAPTVPARRQPLAAPILNRERQSHAPLAATMEPIPLARDHAPATSMIWEQL